MMNRVESAGLTDIGRKRKINQDALFLDDGLGLYVVADGMGGHRAGEVASRIVVDTLRDEMADSGNNPAPTDTDDTLSSEANRLLSAIRQANRNVFQTSRDNEEFKGMGSTVSAVSLSGETIIGANVGDSPIYLIHRDRIDEISVPHTLAAEQAGADPDTQIPPEDALHHILTRAIGTQESISADLCEIQGFRGDILVIGSDGLSNKVSREEIARAARQMPPAEACSHLVATANQRGGEDNITVLIVKMGHPSIKYTPLMKPFIHFFRKVFPVFRNKRRTVQRRT